MFSFIVYYVINFFSNFHTYLGFCLRFVADTGFCGTCKTSASPEECPRAGLKLWANNSLISLSSFDMGPWKMVLTDGEGTLVS